MAHSKKIFLITKLTLCMIDIEINKTKHGKAKKKYMCVFCHMSKKSRVGRLGLSFFFFFLLSAKPEIVVPGSGITFSKFTVSRHLLKLLYDELCSFSTFFALNFDKKLAVE